MCGINVIIDSQAPKEWIDQMNQALEHRGPDASGTYQSPSSPTFLGSRRLKIIDLENGDMPYHSPCGRYSMVYNGEIYNFQELRSKVSDYSFSSQSDGEVLFALLQKLGSDAVKECNGMFSFTMWDEHEKQLTIGRDRLGIKPLFYAHINNQFYLSSELKALQQIPELNRGIDHQAMYHYLSLLSFQEPWTIYPNIKRFPKAHTAIYKNNQLSFKKYWDVSFNKVEQSEEAWKKQIKETFLKSVERRLVSDVPMGLLLSGGLDSNIIAQVTQKEFGKKLHSYSLGFEGGEDESQLAEKSAQLLGLPFSKYTLKPTQLLDDLPDIIAHFAEPFAGGLPVWFLCRSINRDITVGLTGTGGDELFGNYGRINQILKNMGPIRALKSLIKYPNIFKDFPNKLDALKFQFKHGATIGHFYHEKVHPFKEQPKRSLLTNPSPQRTDYFLESVLRQTSSSHVEDKIFRLDLKTQLSEEFLFSQDILSMASNMELRVPFLDHELVECCASLPTQLRSNPKDPKAWMREVFSDYIPEHIANKPKTGFMIPYGHWLRNELKSRAEFLIDKNFLNEQNIFNAEQLHNVWAEHQAGEDHTYKLWSILMFQIWFFQQNKLDLKW